MNLNLKATNFELTPAIREYAGKKVNGLEKFIHRTDESVQAWVEVGRTTNHHNKGDVYRVEIQIHIPHYGKGVRAEVSGETLNEAIDSAHDKIKLELEKVKDRKMSLIRKGARAIKKLVPFFK
ncbi:MAG: ribosomal subunit interface protein [Candidatus Terrybacteria bacterium RIFCSPLOWO2_02_42_20]|uniref:Ribosomal subunit interface protein n=2 Tax=Candidatus Terryibacteriota TaxID=1817920 RepID=A0A1G2PQK5_9BACT|nr:MAG: ribosomal subunit interface protein [Candidatus Terrybacteria bacterium RIFCSPHIGHO2_02_41_19]OHA54265.1 MAG: ribosomal subunit interface protein [Candidatus Terrybacteria bacterium RIFCSPLOWO2_02_42_20]